jgi:hypothetical protein
LRDQECQKTQKPLFIILSVPEWLNEKKCFRYEKDVLRITVGKKDSTTSEQKNVRAHFSQGILKWGERSYSLTFIARLTSQISGLVKSLPYPLAPLSAGRVWEMDCILTGRRMQPYPCTESLSRSAPEGVVKGTLL